MITGRLSAYFLQSTFAGMRILHKGQIVNVEELAARIGVSEMVIYRRLAKGLRGDRLEKRPTKKQLAERADRATAQPFCSHHWQENKHPANIGTLSHRTLLNNVWH